ncbi:MAG: hypothetical protein LBI82_09015 [Dysgonamonadaceae bacterium]|jgi:hypothetical protein|nr:hypothetical protein [Dysgonamonadaceae bacterium]
MNKKMYIFAVLFSIAVFVGCNNALEEQTMSWSQKDIFEKEIPDVLATYTTQLPDGVDSIKIVTENHSLYKNAIKSLYIKDKNLDVENIGIYYYSGNKIALLAENNDHNTVYAYIVDSSSYIAYFAKVIIYEVSYYFWNFLFVYCFRSNS